MKISFSIADLPLGIPIEECFDLASELKVDGVEIVLVGKTRFFQHEINRLSERYRVPILSVHQPPWSFLGIWYDENMFEFAATHKASINFHPLKDASVGGKRAEHFFTWMQEKSSKYKVHVMLENMPKPHKYIPYISPFFLSVCHPTTSDFEKLAEMCRKYEFGFTLDTDHLHVSDAHKSPEFEVIYPYLSSVHISSFDTKMEHMSLTEGLFNSNGLLKELQNRKYNGLMTLELTPHYFYDKKKYFEDITKSIGLIRENIV